LKFSDIVSDKSTLY